MAQFRLCWFGILYRMGDPDEDSFTLTRTVIGGDNGHRSEGQKRNSG